MLETKLFDVYVFPARHYGKIIKVEKKYILKREGKRDLHSFTLEYLTVSFLSGVHEITKEEFYLIPCY
jgi:hypothetical protein